MDLVLFERAGNIWSIDNIHDIWSAAEIKVCLLYFLGIWVCFHNALLMLERCFDLLSNNISSSQLHVVPRDEDLIDYLWVINENWAGWTWFCLNKMATFEVWTMFINSNLLLKSKYAAESNIISHLQELYLSIKSKEIKGFW